MKIKYYHLYNNYMKRRFTISFAFFFRGMVIGAIFLMCMSLLGYAGYVNWESAEGMRGTLIMSLGYIVIMLFVIPMTLGRINWRKYMLPGIYRYVSNKNVKINLRNEHFYKTIEECEMRRFAESEHWFCIGGVLVAKNLIEEIDVEYHGSYKSHTLSYNILLSTGDTVYIYDVEVPGKNAKSKDQPITRHIADFYLNRGYKKAGYRGISRTEHSKLRNKKREDNLRILECDEHSIWNQICNDEEYCPFPVLERHIEVM